MLFVALQVDHFASYGPGSAQYTWFESNLASTHELWKTAFFQSPPCSPGSHGGDSSVRSTLGPFFAQYGVDLVFNGHDHDHERSVVGGAVYIVTGGGEAPPYGQGNYNPYSVYFERTPHCAHVTVNGRLLSSVGVRPDSTQFDAFTVYKPLLYLPLVLANYHTGGSTLLPPPINR